MRSIELGSDALRLAFFVTLRSVSAEEINKSRSYLSLCTRAFERFVGKGQWEYALTICGRAKITSLNRQYRNRNRPTDVLSFPLHENLKDGGSQGLPRLCLGDIYICREVALGQAGRFQISYYEELAHLFVHGFLHLLGYDHEISPSAEREMLQREGELLEDIIGSSQWKNLSK